MSAAKLAASSGNAHTWEAIIAVGSRPMLQGNHFSLTSDKRDGRL